MSLLKIENLTKTYANGRGIKGLDLEIHHGEVVALLGPNGSGKTTAIKTMLGLLHKNKGCIEIQGYNEETHMKDILRLTGAVIGNPAHYEYMTAFENLVLMQAFFTGITKEDIEAILEKVGLLEFQNEKVKGFSTGMKQRLAIAKAMLHHPPLLILDEPFSGMDIEGRAKIKALLKNEIEKKQLGVLISSHQIFDIEDWVTKVCIINESQWLGTESMIEITKKQLSLEAHYLNRVQEERGHSA